MHNPSTTAGRIAASSGGVCWIAKNRWRLLVGACILLLCQEAAVASTMPPSLAPMLQRVAPSVVSIVVRGTQSTDALDELEDAGNPAPSSLTEATGSGAIIDATAGYILTSDHVVAKAEAVTVKLYNGKTYEATIVGEDAATDLAVIRIEASGLSAMSTENGVAPKVGDYVVAIGNPFGLGQSATFGIVSAIGRQGLGLEGYEDFIQTDAATNPGNSGGPLVDMNGELIGINTAIIGPAGGSVGIGFAIPISMAKDIAVQLIAYGQVRRGQLGVLVQDNNEDLQKALSITVASGALVGEVIPGSPAERSGIRLADVIVGVGNFPVQTAEEFRLKIASFPPGTTVSLTIVRPNGKTDLSATLAANLTTNQPKPSHPLMMARGLLSDVTLQDLVPGSDLYGATEGALVVSLDDRSRASIAGLAVGDVIVSINRRPVASPQAVIELAARGRDLILLGIYRNGHTRFLVVK
ncbi:trypsin-like peptidase domain-containing protein [Rhizobium sp. BK376]|uniref:trypsin-like peptidase domain-containing protein n=1 Tax=Rhizobium sp. BK376 TaxID=2512149 RepID=UPI0010528E2C|nr:trypsin-like peptidase domain-containing protein [Rhizobium sp. BK376]TCR75617.1 serine protease Do/serine protease DegQ [Rhizobium sp. BK376]